MNKIYVEFLTVLKKLHIFYKNVAFFLKTSKKSENCEKIADFDNFYNFCDKNVSSRNNNFNNCWHKRHSEVQICYPNRTSGLYFGHLKMRQKYE